MLHDSFFTTRFARRCTSTAAISNITRHSLSGSTLSSSMSMSALDKPSVGVGHTGLVEDYIGKIGSGSKAKGCLLQTVMGTNIRALREHDERELKQERGKRNIAKILQKSLSLKSKKSSRNTYREQVGNAAYAFANALERFGYDDLYGTTDDE